MSNFRSWFDEKSEEAQEQFLGEYPRLLLDGKKYPELFKLLSNYYFIEAKINHPLFGVQALIEDYDLLQDETKTPVKTFHGTSLHSNSNTTISSLKKIQGALRLSAHIINQDSQQLPAQLTGRLLHFHTPQINNLLQQIATNQGLRCLTPSLTPPGSPLIRTLSGHSRSVNAIAVTPDGKTVISGSWDNTIKIWDVGTGTQKFTLEGHSDPVNAIAVTPDGKTVISGSRDNTIKIWDVGTGTQKFTLEGHSDPVNAIAVTPDGKTVISGSWDNTIKIWDVVTGKEIATFTGESPILCCAVAPDGVTIVAGERSGRLHFLRLQGKVTDE
ncbi:WD40 repeat domain-containing protein [Dolichospermum circinale CS-534/05]|uniref:WD40 repeat domain-containing protein n=1 Tax=Dolichospermum circinale TaxID=109265 RepID=UPI002330F052|nr:WD40 repeat domain-containing protein [Dolichospermum circinale]MDB9492226.1 WD40 repeat domain-containing protein [Dolichospermum circinale CS-534/05]